MMILSGLHMETCILLHVFGVLHSILWWEHHMIHNYRIFSDKGKHKTSLSLPVSVSRSGLDEAYFNPLNVPSAFVSSYQLNSEYA